MASVKAREKRHALVRKGWEASVPKFDPENYNLSLMKILSHFSAEVEGKAKQALAIQYWKKIGKPVAGFDKVPDGYFGQAGVLAWLASQEQTLEDRDVDHLHRFYTNIKKIADEKLAVVAEDTPRATVKDYTDILARKHGAEFDAALDDFCYVGTNFDPDQYLKANEIKAPVAKQIAQQLKPVLDEFSQAASGKDDQLIEAYEHFGKRGLKKVVDFLTACINACEKTAIIAKVTRKPRKHKEKPASVVAAKVKYMKEDAALKLKSVPAEKMVGADSVWVFNTKYRKLFKYVAQEGMTLTVKGTTLQNWDPAKSGAKTVRKPEEYFKDVASLSKRPWDKLFNDIRGVLAKCTGRINEECLIVKVF